MDTENGNYVTEMPVGYRFVPTDEELVEYYLKNKVLDRPIPAQVIHDIDAREFYSNHPKFTVPNPSSDEKEWFYFIHHDEHFYGKKQTIRIVGNEVGFWKSMGGRDLYNSDGDVLAFKINLTYFSGSSPRAKKTIWKMEEFRLPIQQIEEWVLGRILKGREYLSNN